MKILSDKYRKTLKRINIKFTDLTAEDLKTCLTQLSLFKNLRSLNLTIDSNESQQNFIDECLEQMTRNCVKLKNFRLEINDNSLISDDFFAVLSHLKSIERLEIVLGIIIKIESKCQKS